MKNIGKKYTALSLAALLLAGSCTDRFEEINTNPSTYGQANFNPNFLLTTTQLTYTGSTDFAFETWRGNLIYCSTLMQGLATVVSYWGGDKYLLNESYTAAYWERAYSDQVKPVTDLVQFTTDKDQYKNLHQVSRIMRAMIMERITDLYGDAPYSEAGLGYYTGIITPKYDTQEFIYADLLKEVEEATNALDPAADVPTGDMFYNGNIAQWQRFGNSLLLRMAMRLTKVNPELAQQYVTKVQGKTMQNNADNAYVLGDDTGGRTTRNRNSQILRGDGGQENFYVKWSKTFIDYLKANDDPRLSQISVTRLYLPDADGNPTTTQSPGAISTPAVQKGLPNGKDLGARPAYNVASDPNYTTFSDYSSPSPGMIKYDGPMFILTYAESELLLADAAQRWGIGGAAVTHYNNGVTAAMTYLSQYDASLNVSPAAVATYLTAHPYNAATGLEMINTQYWAHTNTMLDFYESWSNWRRTGYPVLTPVMYPNNATNGTIPRRFPYPTSEITSNNANYQAASAAVPGGDFLTGRVWWDK